MRRIFLLCLVALAITTSASAQQKLAHVNFGNVLAAMPEVTAADKVLATLNDSLITVMQERADKLQKEYTEVEANVKNLTPAELRKKQTYFQTQQAELERMQQLAPQVVEARRRKLLGPVIEKAKAAIEKIAKAKGYDIVMDSSIFNAVLFVEEGNDLTEEVKAALQ